MVGILYSPLFEDERGDFPHLTNAGHYVAHDVCTHTHTPLTHTPSVVLLRWDLRMLLMSFFPFN